MIGTAFKSVLAARGRLAVWGLVLLLGTAVLAISRESASQAAGDEGALPSDLARVAPDSFLVASWRVSAVWNSEIIKSVREQAQKELPDLFQKIEKELGVGIPEIERITMVMHGLMNEEPIFLIRTTKPYDKIKVLKSALPEHTEKKTDKGTIYIGKDRKALSLLDPSVYVLGAPNSVEAFADRGAPQKDGPLSPVLKAAAGNHIAVVGINPEPLAALSDQLPPNAEPFKPLLAAKTLMLAVDWTDKVQYGLRGTFRSAEDAKNAEKAAEDGRQLVLGFLAQGIQEVEKQGKDTAPIVELMKLGEAGLKGAKIQRKDSVVEATLAVKVDPNMLSTGLLAAVQKIRESAKRIQSANNLKQIALAMHNYHDVNGAFPPAAIYDKNGKPLLSWRVLILPYIEQDNLFKEFHLDEPWDSEHNKKLLEQMPKVYQTVEEEAKQRLTRYQGFIGKGAFFEGAKGIRIADITDGTSNTIMVVEAAKGVPWSKPDDIPFDQGKLVPRVGGVFKDGFNAGFCDGSVHFLKKTISEKTMRLLVERNDGQPIGDFDN